MLLVAEIIHDLSMNIFEFIYINLKFSCLRIGSGVWAMGAYHGDHVDHPFHDIFVRNKIYFV